MYKLNKMQIFHLKQQQVKDEIIELMKYLGENIKILVVDDEVYNLMVLQMMFEKIQQVKIVTAMSAFQGLETLIANQTGQQYFQIIIVDINMPGMDGLQMVRKMRRMIEAQEIHDMLIF